MHPSVYPGVRLRCNHERCAVAAPPSTKELRDQAQDDIEEAQSVLSSPSVIKDVPAEVVQTEEDLYIAKFQL